MNKLNILKNKNVSNLITIAILSILLVIAMGVSATLAYFTDERNLSGPQEIAFGTIDLQSLNNEIPSNDFTWSSVGNINLDNLFLGENITVNGELKSLSTGDFYVYINPTMSLEKRVGDSWLNLGEIYQGIQDPVSHTWVAPAPEVREQYKAFEIDYEYLGLLKNDGSYTKTEGWVRQTSTQGLSATLNDGVGGEALYDVGVVSAGTLENGAVPTNDSGYVHSIHMQYDLTMKETLVFYTSGDTLTPLTLNDIESRETNGEKNYRFNFSVEFRAVQKRNFFDGETNAVPDLYQVGTDLNTKTINDVHEYITIKPFFTGEYKQWDLTDETNPLWLFDSETNILNTNYDSNVGNMLSVYIPGYYLNDEGRYVQVESLGNEENIFFDTNETVEHIIIGTGVKGLSDNTFMDNCEIKTIQLPSTLQKIGTYAFDGCFSIEQITIPKSVVKIKEGAFTRCSSLTSFSVESGNINYLMADDCLIETSTKTLIKGFSTSVIPTDGIITRLGDYAFFDCSSLTGILTIPDSITSIGDCAFSFCSGLTGTLIIPDSITSIGESAFSGCSSLTSVILPDSITSISYGVFSDCFTLTSITIPNSVTIIGSCAFSGCSSLTSVILPDSITSIGDYAFFNNSGLTGTLIIPNSVTSIGNSAFSNCSGLTGTLTIPDSVTSIGNSAFSNCSGLTSITIPNSVTIIGSSAFSNCSGLTSITIPNSVTSIGNSAFSGCSGLTTITLPFVGDSIKTQSDANINPFCYIFGRTSYIGGTKTLQNYWSNNTQYSFYYYIPTSLTTVTILGGNILQYAFMNCNNLTDIILPNGITSIGDAAFFNCGGLTNISIPNSVTSIGNSAFYYCTGLTSVIIPEEVTSIGSGAFLHCSGLIGLTIPNSVTSIGDQAFNDCGAFISLTIGNGVTSVGVNAFYNCINLTSVFIDSQTIAIGLIDTYSMGSLAINIKAGEFVYIKNDITTISSYFTSSFTQVTTDVVGYNKYQKN